MRAARAVDNVNEHRVKSIEIDAKNHSNRC
jgi:hypothetical protein